MPDNESRDVMRGVHKLRLDPRDERPGFLYRESRCNRRNEARIDHQEFRPGLTFGNQPPFHKPKYNQSGHDFKSHSLKWLTLPQSCLQ